MKQTFDEMGVDEMIVDEMIFDEVNGTAIGVIWTFICHVNLL